MARRRQDRDCRFQIQKSKSSKRTQNYKMEKDRYRKAHHRPSENYDKRYANEKFKSYNGSCLPRPVPSRSFEVQRDSFGCRSSQFDLNNNRRDHHKNSGSFEDQRDSFGSRASEFDSNNNRRYQQSWTYPTTSETSQPNQSYYQKSGPNDPSASNSNPDGRYNRSSDSGQAQGGHRFGIGDPRPSNRNSRKDDLFVTNNPSLMVNNDSARERSTSFEISATHPGKSPTVLLLQPYKNPESRTYSFYNSVKDCMEAIIDTFEQKLKKEYPPSKYPDINYHLGNLYAYIEQFVDINCLVYQKCSNTYAPYNRDWIREKIFLMLRKQQENNCPSNIVSHL